MNCDRVQKTLSDFLDRKLAYVPVDRISEHLEACRDCSRYAQELDDVHSALRGLPLAKLPVRLVTELQILASRERVRRVSRGTIAAQAHYWASEIRLFFDNLMRPFAIPFAGGLISAVF